MCTSMDPKNTGEKIVGRRSDGYIRRPRLLQNPRSGLLHLELSTRPRENGNMYVREDTQPTLGIKSGAAALAYRVQDFAA
jgi:hypothetical protein